MESRKMKIGLLWDADYPWDVRVEKVTETLIKNGYEVHLICRNQAMRPVFEKIGGLHIHRLPILVKFSKKINSFLSFPAFFNIFWLIKLAKVIRMESIDYLIVRDLPLCPAAIWISRIYKIPCAMDMAECYPELLRCIWKYESFRFTNIFVRNPLIADVVENYCLRNLDKIYVMIEEARDRLMLKGIPVEKIVIVSNTPNSDFIKSNNNRRKTNNRNISILYLGILNPSRGLDTVIDGISVLKLNGVNCLLRIAGTGKFKTELEKQVHKLGLDENVEFLGWVDRRSIEELFQEADVGVVPHHVCGHWNATIPNKLFDYMAAGIPVLSTDVRPMSRIIQSYKCGVIYQDYDLDSFIGAIHSLLDEQFRVRLGANGRKAIDDIFNWENDSLALLDNIPKMT